ncbi:acyl-CoA oxidase [Tieghemostelium lacteum]|uniref:Acyl-coenzyme A oxidase n=1 Tax=Tieghemostelium lacteum TaxID=361077 RepID=A0A151ZEC5_TIELA|nr:acyl-CoA oxidase [Tieghemostelium lacteum]|eukprot:KYQ92308.1 acyl-CoA oxidase [Tieghemostelium lacteum]
MESNETSNSILNFENSKANFIEGYSSMLTFQPVVPIQKHSISTTSTVPLYEKLKNWNIQGIEHQNLRTEIFKVLGNKQLFYSDLDASKEQQRLNTLKQLQSLLSEIFGKDLIHISDIKDDPSKILALIDCLSQFDDSSLLTKLVVNNYLFGAAVYNLGTERHHKLLPEIECGKLLGCFAMTELGHGSNVRSLETTATYDPKTDEFIMNTPVRTATKWWIGNAAHAVVASVFARLILDGKDHEVHCFLVPLRKRNGIDLLPGVKIGDVGPKFGLNGVDNGWIQFDQVRIPSSSLLDKFGSVTNGVYSSPISNPSRRFANILAQMITGRISISFGTIRSFKTALVIATRYALKRLQFGPSTNGPEIPIMEYPTHQLEIMPMIATTYAYDAIKLYLARRFMERQDENEIHVLASGLKAVLSHYITVSILELRRMCGGHGYSSNSKLHRLLSSVDVGRTFEGDNTLLLQQVAKDLLTQFKKEYTSNKFTGTLKYLSKNTSLLLSGLNPYTTNRRDESHLLSFQFLLDSMEFRSSKLLIQSAQLVSKNYNKTKNSFIAWNQSLETLLHLARAHTETMIISRFIESINNEKDAETKKILTKLCQLYGLYRIRMDFEFYRNSNYLKKGKARAIIKLIQELCADLAQNAALLVKGFGNEESLIDSPLGLEDGDLYDNICKRVGLFSDKNYPEPILKSKL